MFTETKFVERTRRIGIAGTAGGAVLMALQLSGMLNSHPVKIAIDFAVIALLLLVVMFPARLTLLGAACLTAGLSIIVFGAHILGLCITSPPGRYSLKQGSSGRRPACGSLSLCSCFLRRLRRNTGWARTR
jgi:hypothetical protein